MRFGEILQVTMDSFAGLGSLQGGRIVSSKHSKTHLGLFTEGLLSAA